MAETPAGAANLESVSPDNVSEPNAAIETRDEISGREGGGLEDLDSTKTPIPQMSKTAQKRLAKQKYLDERKKARREHEKEQRKAKVAQRKVDREKEAAEMTPEEREEKLKEVRESRKDRKFESGTRKERLTQALEASHNVVLDLDFGPMMRPQEIKSLMQQVMYCYAANNRAEHPCRLTLTGCQGEVLQQLQKLSGFENWRIHRSTEPYLDVFANQKDKLVYLTADSPNLMEDLESDKIYIIGGLVDRNRYKDITFKKAQEQGIATGKLPIGQHVKLLSSQVLTVNQVMEILLRYLESRDWHKALLAAIPQRKRRAGQDADSANADSAKAESANAESAEGSRDKLCLPADAGDAGNATQGEGVTTSPLEGALSSFLPRGDAVPLPVDRDSEKEELDREERQKEAKRVKES